MAVCLVMIVKNEAKILPRCLRSARPHIDHWLIVDTGSSDETVEVVRRELEGIPGQCVGRPWVNFGLNRSEAFGLARRIVADREHTWALLLDADHELIDEGFDRSALSADGYLLLQRDGGLEYPNLRLLRMDYDRQCVGSTHEFWHVPEGTKLCVTLRIVDHQDGASHGEKFQRDRELLMAELRKNPESERAVFYLGQTLEGLGHPATEDLYRLRASMGGYEEERWIARYRAARTGLERDGQRIELARTLGKRFAGMEHSTAVAEMLAAAAENPQRAEPLWHLARYYRRANQPALGHVFAKRARAIRRPESALFLEHWVYDVGIDQELAVACYYAGDVEEGAAACERLEHAGDGFGRGNAHWYASPLGGVSHALEVPEQLRTFDGVLYHCSNPSLTEGSAVVRLVNYDQQGGKQYLSRGAGEQIRTRNAVIDESGVHLLDDRLPEDWPESSILGLEDLRLCRHDGAVWFTATCCQTPHAPGRPQVVLGRIDTSVWRVDHLTPIAYGRSDREKNWLPFSEDGHLYLVYSLSPLVVLEVEPMTGEVLGLAKCAPWTAPGRFRGSAGPVRVGDYHIAVSHDVAYLDSGNVYTHRFVAWHPREDQFYVSGPFLLEHRGIEYCAGMVRDGVLLRLSYGVEDRAARVLSISVERVLDMLGIGRPTQENAWPEPKK